MATKILLIAALFLGALSALGCNMDYGGNARTTHVAGTVNEIKGEQCGAQVESLREDLRLAQERVRLAEERAELERQKRELIEERAGNKQPDDSVEGDRTPADEPAREQTPEGTVPKPGRSYTGS
ncbi:MAG TPA: hypothetical protein VJT09_04990 [Pyrinomonadaceae bacterium]|nr:hypothetical protein [Pyrinomonadaceae bacterium]